MAGRRAGEINLLMLERILEVGLYSLAWAMAIGGFVSGAIWGIYTITQENYKK